MTKLIVNAIQVLKEDIRDGVVSISSADVQYSQDRMVLPQFERKKLVNGQATFDNVAPGRIIVQFAWDLNRTATVRATVPLSGSVTLAELVLQRYDNEPAIVSQITTAVEEAKEVADRLGTAEDILRYHGEAVASAESAEADRKSSLASAQKAEGHERNSAQHGENAETAAELAEEQAQKATTARQAVAKDREQVELHSEHIGDQVKHVDSQAESIDAKAQKVNADAISAQEAADRTGTAEDILALYEEAHQASDRSVEAEQKIETDLLPRAEAAAETATTAVEAEIHRLKGDVPEAFDTLEEIVAELEANETERAAITNTVAKKADRARVEEELLKIRLQIAGRGALFHGYGPPGTIAGAVIGDKYLDLEAMEIYILGGANIG